MRSTDESFEENYGAPRELALPTRLLEPGPCIRGAYIANSEMWRRISTKSVPKTKNNRPEWQIRSQLRPLNKLISVDIQKNTKSLVHLQGLEPWTH